ncbi:YjzD family protein [Neobacillus massiliamazoniensis]|uniref:DeoR family transcriptional regulator n=1 Tax=Neobacillus massiliamazoniensis TaxID=1499688 RepID=A0A0U1P049_9BACI|nr:YjzD family protein [Neobacillus massiliamazoniensis]CRK83482.1 DeoR family transcriptional regulator [Neobacillus massiliamazoniensis]
MRFFWTFFWSFLLVEMLTYVVSSMIGVGFDFKIGAILSVCVTILIFVASTIIPNEPVEKH